MNIGAKYNKYKWNVPKLLYVDDKLICVDGMHRMYGSFLGNIDNVTVEIMDDITEQEAIEIFVNQSKDKQEMSLEDMFEAGLRQGIEEYVTLKKICDDNNVEIKGRRDLENPVGVLTSLSDGLSLAKTNSELLNKILKLIGRLQWNGGAVFTGKAYKSKIIRVLKRLYAYYGENEKAMEEILLENCMGAKYFNDNIAETCTAVLFDNLSDIISNNIPLHTEPETKQKVTKITRIA